MSEVQTCPDCNKTIGSNSDTCLTCERSLWTGDARIAQLEQQLAEARKAIEQLQTWMQSDFDKGTCGLGLLRGYIGDLARIKFAANPEGSDA